MIRETEIKKYSHAEKAAMSESWKKSTVSEDGTGKISRVNNWKIFRLFVPVCQRHR